MGYEIAKGDYPSVCDHTCASEQESAICDPKGLSQLRLKVASQALLCCAFLGAVFLLLMR
jgi:hypothetical protein